MSGDEKPERMFVYPGGERMCQSGRIRAALEGSSILRGELDATQIYERARKGEWAQERGADTNKHNLISLVVAKHARLGTLRKFTNEQGDFLDSNGRLRNIEEPVFSGILNNLKRK